jgi:SAM-dependent methyltransferase
MDAVATQTPWDWMQPHDVARMGEVISDPAEQQRWCRAVMLGGLPYMWRVMAKTVRDLMWEKLELRPNDRVLIVGESVESCAFPEDIRARIGPGGEIRVVDITEEARDAYIAGRRGRHGQLATWTWDYTSDVPDGTYDVVAVLQAVQHADDWNIVGKELLRTMKSGRSFLMAEITFSPRMLMLANMDLHLQYWLEKIFSRVGWNATDFPYYSAGDLHRAFDGLAADCAHFEWKGVELFWGRKP